MLNERRPAARIPKEFDLNDYESHAGSRPEESCIVGGEALRAKNVKLRSQYLRVAGALHISLGRKLQE
jgi:hypothetical protein